MRGVRPYSTTELESMPTRRLLGHLTRLRTCEESQDQSDGPPFGADYRPEELVYFKDDPRWTEQCSEVKRILAGREHVPRSRSPRKPR
jgi:hypothetical protein